MMCNIVYSQNYFTKFAVTHRLNNIPTYQFIKIRQLLFIESEFESVSKFECF